MKNLFLVALFFTLASTTKAQITFNLSDMPAIGWNHKVAQDTIIYAQNWGNAGANQTYTFTNFQTMLYDTVMYKALTSTQQSRFSNGDIAITADNTNFLIGNSTANDFRYEGLEGVLQGCATFVNFSPVPVAFQFPTVYGGKYANNSGFTKTISGSCVGQPLVSDIKLTSSTIATDTIDGWGKVTTLLGNYKCLRQKRVEFVSTKIEYRFTALSPWTTLSNTIDTNIRYYYLTKEAKGSVITFDYDSVDNPIKATWSTIPPAPLVPTFTQSTNVATTTFTSSVDGYPDSYSWNFGDGTPTSSAVNPTHTYAANGNFIVCLTVMNGQFSYMKCDTVKITGLATTSNFPPNAQNDTATISQFGSALINATANDNDPNGDTICIKHLWGSPAAWLSIANCNQIRYMPDSSYSGIDTFFYQVCDNQLPSLCDTAMVVVTVECSVPIVSSITRQSNPCWGYKFTSNSVYSDTISWSVKNIFPVGFIIDTVLINKNFITIINTANGCGNGLPNVDLKVKNGQYEVCYRAFNSCGFSNLVCDTMFTVADGINELPSSSLSLLPNPAKSTLHISLKEKLTAAKLLESDVLGRLVFEVEFADIAKTIDVASWQSGLYFITIQNNESRVTNRFIKE